LPLIEGRLRQVDKEMRKIYGQERRSSAERFLTGREKARALLADLREKDLNGRKPKP
jgi:hypothetical protein